MKKCEKVADIKTEFEINRGIHFVLPNRGTSIIDVPTLGRVMHSIMAVNIFIYPVKVKIKRDENEAQIIADQHLKVFVESVMTAYKTHFLVITSPEIVMTELGDVRPSKAKSVSLDVDFAYSLSSMILLHARDFERISLYLNYLFRKESEFWQASVMDNIFNRPVHIVSSTREVYYDFFGLVIECLERNKCQGATLSEERMKVITFALLNLKNKFQNILIDAHLKRYAALFENGYKKNDVYYQLYSENESSSSSSVNISSYELTDMFEEKSLYDDFDKGFGSM